jgi:drug/metabolite transporter (DMT)-like permease
MSRQQIGIFMAICGSLLFSTKAVLVKLAYQYPVDAVSLLTIRMLTALPIYIIILLMGKKGLLSLRRSHWLMTLIAAFLGYYTASFLDFWGLQFVDASVERLILFTYPTFIVLILWVFYRESFTRKVGFALLLSYVGVLWVFSPQFHAVSLTEGFWMGALAIFLCAVAYAVYMVFSQRLIPHFGSSRYTSIVMMLACGFVIGHYVFTLPIDQITKFDTPVYLYGIAMGILATVLPSYLINFAIQRIGASKTAIIASVGPVSTITLAYIFLGERLVWQQWIGAIFIVWSVTVISLERKKK